MRGEVCKGCYFNRLAAKLRKKQGEKMELRDKKLEMLIRYALLGGLAYACFIIVKPFLGAIVWAAIIAVSVLPLFERLEARMRGKSKRAAVVLMGGLGVLLLVPMIVLVNSLVELVPKVSQLILQLAGWLEHPPAWLSNIPLVSNVLSDWQVSGNDVLVAKIKPYVNEVAVWGLGQGTHLTKVLLQMVLAIVLAGVFLVGRQGLVGLLREMAGRVGGGNAAVLVGVAERTIRGVMVGVVGTALVQALLAVIGFALAGVPAIALLGMATFILAVLQLPTIILILPVAGWLYATDNLGWAIFLLVWGFLVVGSVDNFLKPMLISQEAKLPLSLIFVGVLGGMLAWGFLGIFLGATLLALAYSLFNGWLSLTDAGEAIAAGREPD